MWFFRLPGRLVLPGITQGTRGGGSGRAEEDGTGLAERKTNELNLTDITGFGILGHTQNLAKQQGNEVSFVIHNLPVLAKMAAVSKACGNMFGLMHGTCPETSGTRALARVRG